MESYKPQHFSKGYYQKCPECNVYFDIVTNAHCRINHNMTKAEVEEKHGRIEYIKRRSNL
ncbi:hypothetical protein [Enterococcus sp. N249-2]